jgi:hypothetical protein
MTYFNTADGTIFTAKSSFDYLGTTIYPELMLRNSALPVNNNYDNYRLMTFQFQDIMPSDGAYGESARDDDTLSFTIDCKDYTKQLINVITSSYIDYATGSFAEYLAAAEDFCSYNNIDGYFNDFFIESMESNYVDDPQSAPWVVMPVIHNMHLDLVNGTFGGSMDKITDASIILSEQIAPATGRLEELQTFNNNLQSIIDFYNGATFTGIMDSYDSEETVKFGTEILESVGNRFGLPDFLNLAPADLVSVWDWSTTGDALHYDIEGNNLDEDRFYKELGDAMDWSYSVKTAWPNNFDGFHDPDNQSLAEKFVEFGEFYIDYVLDDRATYADAYINYFTPGRGYEVDATLDTIQTYIEDGDGLSNKYYKVQMFIYSDTDKPRLKIVEYIGTSHLEQP